MTWKKKVGNRKTKKPLVKECTHKGMKIQWRDQNHPSLKINETTKLKSKTQVVFYIFLVLTLWPVGQPSSHTFGSASYTGFLTEEKKERKRCCFRESHVCLDCPQKRSASRKMSGERIYNHSVKRHHPLLERNRESITRSWKDSEPASNWCLEYFMLLCAHEPCKCVRDGLSCYSETVFSCVSSSCRQLLRTMGSGWASVLKTQSSSGRRSSSEKSRYRYLGRQEVVHFIQLWCKFSGFVSTADCIERWMTWQIKAKSKQKSAV